MGPGIDRLIRKGVVLVEFSTKVVVFGRKVSNSLKPIQQKAYNIRLCLGVWNLTIL